MYTALFFLVLLILLNAFFAASEIALISLNDNKVRIMAEEGNPKAKLIKGLLDEPGRFLATIQIGITLAGFLASAFAAENFAADLAGLISRTGVNLSPGLLKNISVILITIVLSYFTLVLGELVPKRLAMKRAEKISMAVARPLQLLSLVAGPFVRLLSGSTNLVVRLFGINPREEDENVTEEEIRMMVDVGEEKGTIHEEEKEMINNIFEFDNKTVSDIMTHRTDITALPVEAQMPEVVAMAANERFSRIPVYEDNIDNIIGVLYIKDLLRYADPDVGRKDFRLRDILRQPCFVPASKRTDELFRELQKSKVHMAIIIDEYGGTAGLVTLEDLVEEIVGNIFDEYDEEEKDFDKVGDTTWIISGQVSLDAVADYFGIELPVDEYDTLGGFLISRLGHIPTREENQEVRVRDLLFQVSEADEKKIVRVRASRIAEPEQAGKTDD